MKLSILGTGNAMATGCYNTCYVFSDAGEHFLVDAGGGNTIFRQLEAVGIGRAEIRTIFVTHRHIDHIMGIVWMIRAIGQAMYDGKFEGDAVIYGHDEVIEILRNLALTLVDRKQKQFVDNRIHLETVADGESRTILGRKVTFFDIHSTKAKQFGYCMELGNGERLTCCGDEPYNELEKPYVENCSWLLHEAFCLFSQADRFHPYEKHHSTVKDACELAQANGVKHLLLYHTEDKNIASRKALYTEEGSRYFSGELLVPDDLETFDIE